MGRVSWELLWAQQGMRMLLDCPKSQRMQPDGIPMAGLDEPSCFEKS